MRTNDGEASARAIRSWLREAVGGERFVVVAPMLQVAQRMARQVLELGASGCFLVAARSGGQPPDPELGPQRVLGVPLEGDVTAATYAAERALEALPDGVVAEIEAFDPARDALALAPFFVRAASLAGRRRYGARPDSWQALEDKVVIDALWDAIGVPRAPSAVVPVDEVAPAVARMDRGDGTVWAADARDGFHGAASHTFRVHDVASRRRAEAFMVRHADRVRVMPFLEGIPCSIHGLVLPAAVLAFRPAEMVVLRCGAGSGFLYMRAGTWWDPAPADREALRGLARRVGDHLREAVGYRGFFTIDGILSRDGFVPTELNPRPGAALSMVLPGLATDLLNAALTEGERFPLEPRAWEAERVALADRERAARLVLKFDRAVDVRREFALTRGRGGALRVTDDPARAVVLGAIEPGLGGAFATFEIQPAAVEVGRSVAPLAAELVAWSDAHLGSRFGPVEPAREIR